MDFGGGLATGIAVGLGSGIASGIATGRSQFRQELCKYVDEHGVIIQDRFGKPIKLDEFLEKTCGPEKADCSKSKMLAVIAVGLVVLAALAVMFFLVR